MMPTIRIDDDVLKALQKRATPFVDSPNSVIRRILGLDRQNLGPRKRHSPIRGAQPPAFYQPYILKVLQAHGGRARGREVVAEVFKIVRHSLKDVDLSHISSGGPRWEKNLQWERYGMAQEGLLSKDSPRGVWELTPKGLSEAAKLRDS